MSEVKSPPGSNSPSDPETSDSSSVATRLGDGLTRADARFTRFETALVVIVLCAEVGALCSWILLRGLSTPSESGSAGVVLRGLLGATALGLVARRLLRGRPEVQKRIGTTAAVVVGACLAPLWANLFVDYASNWLGWLQQASFLTLLGGLRGVGTRLTLLLVLLGASLATARGKHITIDLVVRVVGEKAQRALVIGGWAVAACLCFSLSWGFFDYIAIQNFGADSDASKGAKVARVAEELEEQAFIARKQMALDFRTLPRVLVGTSYADYLTGEDYNPWLRSAGFVERYGEEAVEPLIIPDEQKKAPLVVIPGRGEPRGELIHSANLVFPVGLLILGLRFLLRALLLVLGRVRVFEETDEFHHTAPEPVLPKEPA
jgi:hypothetical protein